MPPRSAKLLDAVAEELTADAEIHWDGHLLPPGGVDANPTPVWRKLRALHREDLGAAAFADDHELSWDAVGSARTIRLLAVDLHADASRKPQRRMITRRLE
jgi:hypothetical protein